MDSDRDKRGQFTEGNAAGEQFTEGNKAAIRHGGEAAVKALQRGEPYKGLAAQAEREVQADLEESGRVSLVREIAVRAHTAMRLYWAAVQTAADDGDLDALDRYCKRFGWLAGVAGRAWREVREELKDTRGAGDLLDVAIETAKGIRNGQD